MVESDANHDDAGQPRYRSSAAARMVNIPVATLRVWERRYQVVGPTQAPSGHRLYSSQDVRRLVLIKQLVNRGHGIGMLARMGTPQLQDLMDEADTVDDALAHPPSRALAQAARQIPHSDLVRVLLVGEGASGRWAPQLQSLDAVVVVGGVDGSAASELSLKGVQADVVLADLGALHMETADWLTRLTRTVGARQMIVLYGFAHSQALEALRARAANLRRSPVAAPEVQQLLLDATRGWRSVAAAMRHIPDPAPAPRLSTEALAQLPQLMPRVACECPRHLADLVTMLGQFEAYSADCESLQPADVALHAYLYRVAGHARALMEDALLTLAKAEGIAVPASAVAAEAAA
jgi:DNA-binding transcriptional MerR regulator